MFNWNWTGLIPLSLTLMQIWSDAILNPRVDKKEADLSSGGLMHKNLSSKYGLSSLGKRKRHLTFLIWTVCFLFFLLPTRHKLAFIPFLHVLELFEICWLCGDKLQTMCGWFSFQNKDPHAFQHISDLDGYIGNLMRYLPLEPTCPFPALES